MSENLDLVRSIWDSWEHGDFSSAEWAHPDIEYVLVGGPEPGNTKGLARMAEDFRKLLSAWQDFRADAEEYCERHDGSILVPFRASGHAKASGLDTGQIRTEGAALFQVDRGLVTKLVLYWDRSARDSALADLGLKE